MWLVTVADTDEDEGVTEHYDKVTETRQDAELVVENMMRDLFGKGYRRLVESGDPNDGDDILRLISSDLSNTITIRLDQGDYPTPP